MTKIFLLLCLASTISYAKEAAPRQNVILITLDGVRYHEIFQGVRMPRRAGEPRRTPIIPNVQRLMKESGFLIGNSPKGEPTMWISNKAALSQPGYRAILSGQFEKTCRGNDCPMIDHETIIDRLMNEGSSPKEVAAFSSWDVIDRCLESKTPRAVRSVSFDSIRGLTQDEARPFTAIEAIARNDRPPRWGGSRWDKYTYDMGLLYLKTYRPRFLYMMFVEPDEYGHQNDYKGYVQSLRDFDARLVNLVETLKGMGAYGEETSIVVTTDHGRGRGPYLWRKHSKEWFDARRVWAMALPSEGLRKRHHWRRAERENFFQVDVRPTIETLLGISPRTGTKGRGLPMIEPYAD